MRFPVPLELLAVSLAGLTALAWPKDARADDEEAGHRYGLLASVGGGLAGVVHPGPVPGFIGFTDLGIELLGEVRPWGVFVRSDFQSSGEDGRWNAWVFGGGVQYRLFGNTSHAALFLRGGLSFERWMANNTGCPVIFFAPSSCNLLGQNPSSTPEMTAPKKFAVTSDMLGLLGGIRLEVPLKSFYVGIGATFVPTVALDTTTPSGAFQLRFDLDLGFRDTRVERSAVRGTSPAEYRLRQ